MFPCPLQLCQTIAASKTVEWGLLGKTVPLSFPFTLKDVGFFIVDTVTDFKDAKPIAVVIGSGPGISLCLECKGVSCTCRPEAVDLLIHIVSVWFCYVFLNTSSLWLKPRSLSGKSWWGEQDTAVGEPSSGIAFSITVLPSDCPRSDLPRLAPCAIETTGTQKPVYLVNYDTLPRSNVSC